MNYTITLRNLPFEPDEKQVIYVENQYDEHINALIKANYEWLKQSFTRLNLEFVYLPMLFNDGETREKILYYAPYLTSNIIDKIEFRSSYLLGHICDLDNKGKIAPSFIYAPRKENEDWIFQGQSINIDKYDRKNILTPFEATISEIVDDIAHPRFSARQSSEELFWNKAFKGLKNFGCKMIEEDEGASPISTPSGIDDINDIDVSKTLEELERNIERLRLLGVPLATIAEFVARYETISRLRLTDDLRIFLPDYNNVEVKMPAIYKAVYFLFLNHPEGIILKRIGDYHRELVNYYLQTSNKESLSPRMISTINKIEYPGKNEINIVLSRIKTYIKNVIDEHLAKYYYVVGTPGEPYKIALDNNLIEWEDENGRHK